MCGRYALSATPQELQARFGLQALPEAFGNPDIRPTNWAPIIREGQGTRQAVLCRWGLLPSWAPDEKLAQRTFNARAETVAEKPSFRAAFKHRRCLVPASAFYEWQAVPDAPRKRKWRIATADSDILAIAGLWERWRHPERQETWETFTIITTYANAEMAPIHERMPVLMGETDWETWLDPQVDNPLLLQSLLERHAEEKLAAVPA